MLITFVAICVRVVKPNNVQIYLFEKISIDLFQIIESISTTNFQASCHNPIFGKVWGWHSHSQNGDLGVLRDSQNFKVRLQGQNTSPRDVLHVIRKLLKCRCSKWPRMNHLDIYSTSYSKKKGRESN